MYRTAPPIPSVDRIRSINSPAMGKVTFTQPSSAAAAFLLLLTFNLQSSSFYSFAVQSSQLDITPTTRLMSSMTSSSTPSRSTTDSSSTYLDDIPMGPPDSILGIAAAFRACTDPNKVNICVGAYRDENGQPWVLPSVRAAEQKMLQENANKEYAPIEGMKGLGRFNVSKPVFLLLCSYPHVLPQFLFTTLVFGASIYI